MKTLNSITNKNIITSIILFSCFIFTLINCGTTKKALVNEPGGAAKQNAVTLLAGAVKGGLVENKEMLDIDNVSAVDAITGATNTTFNAGIHTAIDIYGHSIETGLDYMYFDQSVGYALPSFAVAGDRDFSFHQLRLPVTYNFQFFKNTQNEPRFVVKAGFSAGYTIAKSIAEQGNIPGYDFKTWDVGPTLGFAVYPYQFSPNFRSGLYLDFYRGSKIYDDIYHEAKGMGAQSYMKFGIMIQPSNFRY